MFIFYFLGVGLPCRLIFCQFWLCEEAQCVYLRRHLGSLYFIFLTGSFVEQTFYSLMEVSNLPFFSFVNHLLDVFHHPHPPPPVPDNH